MASNIDPTLGGDLTTTGRAVRKAQLQSQFSESKTEIEALQAGTALEDGAVVTTKLADSAVTNSKLADAAADTIRGNNTGGSAAPVDMTVSQALTLLDVEDVTTAHAYVDTAKTDAETYADNAVDAAKDADSVTLSADTDLDATTHRGAMIFIDNHTLTIRAQADVAYVSWQQCVVWPTNSSGATLTASTGVTLSGVSAGSASLTQDHPVALIRTGSDAWRVSNVVPA
jgi:hypothetical protein